jgi:hypothetical protein
MINMHFYLVVMGLGLSLTVHAIPKPPTFGITRAGATTTYTVGPSTYSPITQAPSGTGLKVLDANYSAAPAGYITQANIPVGDTIAAVKVTNPVSITSLAAFAISLVPKLGTLGIVLAVGSALYDYYHNAGLTVNPDGTVSGPPVPIDVSISGSCLNNSHISSTPRAGCDFVNPTLILTITGIDAQGNVFYSCKNSSNTFQTSGKCSNDYNSLCASPSVWDAAYSKCTNPNTNGTPSPVTVAQAQEKLIATPPADPASVIEDIHTADSSGVSDPVSDGTPSITLDTSPMYSSPPKQTVTPDGRVQTSTTTTTATQTSPQSFSLTENTTTTTTNVDGSTSTVTTTNAPPAQTTPPTDPKTDCDKYPNSIGCSEYGVVPTADLLTTVAVPVSLSPTSLGSGSCPAPATFTVGGRTMTMSYSLYCDFATSIAPLIIAFAWLSAGFLVMGSVRE